MEKAEQLALPEVAQLGDDGLGTLTEALASYLDEIDGYRMTCLKHETSTAVRVERRLVRLSRLVRDDTTVRTHLQSVAARLPGWEVSPYWTMDGEAWQRRTQRLSQEQGKKALQTLFTRCIAWDGLPMFLQVHPGKAERTIAVELILLPFTPVLPQLTLRLIAILLRCHEHLLPSWLAAALPQPITKSSVSIREYLERTMPQNLYARQCILAASAAS